MNDVFVSLEDYLCTVLNVNTLVTIHKTTFYPRSLFLSETNVLVISLTFVCLLSFLTFFKANGANVFCFLSSLPLLPPATTAVFGSYLPSLFSQITLYRPCGLAYPCDWRGFVWAKKKTSVDLLVLIPLNIWWLMPLCLILFIFCFIEWCGYGYIRHTLFCLGFVLWTFLEVDWKLVCSWAELLWM
jgi:hypothetical protein